MTRPFSGLLLQAAAMSLCLGLASAKTEGQNLFAVHSHSALDHLLIRAAVADFDGDAAPDIAISRPDGASGAGYRYRIDVQLSRYPSSTFFIESADAALGLEITPRDVDGDRDLDLVITAGGSHRPIAIWLNDGEGGFSPGELDGYTADPWSGSSIVAVHRAVLPEVSFNLRDGSSLRITKPDCDEPVLARTAGFWMSPLPAPLSPATVPRCGRAPPASFQLA